MAQQPASFQGSAYPLAPASHEGGFWSSIRRKMSRVKYGKPCNRELALLRLSVGDDNYDASRGCSCLPLDHVLSAIFTVNFYTTYFLESSFLHITSQEPCILFSEIT
ncbi:hypothetical protein MRX96_035829 [Rhipicephalus microplus]